MRLLDFDPKWAVIRLTLSIAHANCFPQPLCSRVLTWEMLSRANLCWLCGHAAVVPFTAQLAEESALEQLGIEAIRLRTSVLTRGRDTRWVDHVGVDRVCAQPQRDNAVRCHCRHFNLVQAAPPIRPDMIFGKDRVAPIGSDDRLPNRCRRRACPSLVKCRKTFGARLDRAAADRRNGRRPVDPRKAWKAPSADSRRAGNPHRSRLRRSPPPPDGCAG